MANHGCTTPALWHNRTQNCHAVAPNKLLVFPCVATAQGKLLGVTEVYMYDLTVLSNLDTFNASVRTIMAGDPTHPSYT